MTKFQLPTQPYCTSCNEYNLSKIVDSKGRNAGMVSLIDAMALDSPPRVRYFLKSSVERLAPEKGSGFTVDFSNGSSAQVKSLILALPQQPLLSILRSSPSLTSTLSRVGLTNLRALHRVRASAAVKMYVLYEDAWWRNELNLTSGDFNNSAAPPQQTSGTAVPQFPPLAGRYHDGDVRCDPRCRGFLQTTYAFDDVSVAFFRPYRPRNGKPYAVVGNDGDVVGSELLNTIHEELVRLHTPALAQVPGALERTKALRPSLGVLAMWDEATIGFGGGLHDWMRDSRGGATCKSFGECQQVMPPRLLQPFSPLPLYVAGEAFGARNGWCESALQMVENVLAQHFGIGKPGWIDVGDYQQKVIYNLSREIPLHSRVSTRSSFII